MIAKAIRRASVLFAQAGLHLETFATSQLRRSKSVLRWSYVGNNDIRSRNDNSSSNRYRTRTMVMLAIIRMVVVIVYY